MHAHCSRNHDRLARSTALFTLTVAYLGCIGCGGEEGSSAARRATVAPRAESAKSVSPAVVFDSRPQEQTPAAQPSAESYSTIVENGFRQSTTQPLSTFAIDVDTASYSNVRRFLTQNTLPPKDAVRLEELVNYFPYDYPSASNNKDPFTINAEVGPCPWKSDHLLARIGLKGREIRNDQRPASNLVFLIDVSGSMADPNKLPLVQAGLKMLVSKLGENDRVAIVVYAGASGLVLPSTSCDRKAQILAALEHLQAGGSTNGSAGLQLAYDTAVGNFIKGGTNRVILCTDGDFNVGITSEGAMSQLISDKAKSGVFLSVLGFGMGNYKDGMLEKLADRGNGQAAYIDGIPEAKKVLVEQMGGTLVTIAKDVKIQVEFNPKQVESYRLIGYENRLLKARDFNDDKKDAGEIGAGHTVTALYEIVPVDRQHNAPGVDPLRYQQNKKPRQAHDEKSEELLTIKIRYKAPESDKSDGFEFALDAGNIVDTPTDDFRFAAAVASFGMLLRDSQFKEDASWDEVIASAESSLGRDPSGYRAEFLDLARRARNLAGR